VNAHIKARIAAHYADWRHQHPGGAVGVKEKNTLLAAAIRTIPPEVVRAAWHKAGLYPYTLATTPFAETGISLVTTSTAEVPASPPASTQSDTNPPSAKKMAIADAVWDIIKETVVKPAQEVQAAQATTATKRKRAAGVLSTTVGAIVTGDLLSACEEEAQKKEAEVRQKKEAAYKKAVEARNATIAKYHEAIERHALYRDDLNKLTIEHIKAILRVQLGDAAKGMKSKPQWVEYMESKMPTNGLCLDPNFHSLPQIEVPPEGEVVLEGEDEEEDESEEETE
jgi:hypothetical protein